MIRTNYHTHNRLCDGKGSIAEYIAAAVKKNFTALGFSSHAPVPPKTTWNLSEENLGFYLDELHREQQEWAGKLQIYIGLEIDYIPGSQTPADRRWKTLGLDYSIGSVHSTVGLRHNPSYACIDGTADELMRLLHTHHQGSWEDMCGAYFRRISEMVRLGGFSFLSHFDLIKKGNRGYFRESSPWYTALVSRALDEIARSGIIMEINSGGIARGYLDEVYPSPWIIAEARKREIPVMVNSDAHRPQDIDFYFEESQNLLRDAGYREAWVLLDKRWTAIPLGSNLT